jgi:hypothetical protein
MKTSNSSIIETISPLRGALLNHTLYGELRSIEQMRVFMEHHVFAVWDFMSLLKALQRGLTCVEIPWRPVSEPCLARLVNEIVLGEESDITSDGAAISHFELYLRAMNEVGANTNPIGRFIASLGAGRDVEEALKETGQSACVNEFVLRTFRIIAGGRMHEVAAAFTYGREDLIPAMFGELVTQLDRDFPGKLTTFHYYLARHIELDGDEHGEMGREMVRLLCGQDSVCQSEAQNAAVQALESRIRLWDGIRKAIATCPCT